VSVQYLKREDRPTLAYVHNAAEGPGAKLPLVVFMGGYRSDMNGTKATYLEQQAIARGQAFLRFDYSGHGQSDGLFEDGSIGAWLQDAMDILDLVAKGQPLLIVGSSMGGWIALLAARRQDLDIRGLIGIAAAPDFSEDIYAQLTDAQQVELYRTGRVEVANDYSDTPYMFTKMFYEDGKKHLVLHEKRKIQYPVRLIQGMRDYDVPWQTAVKIQAMFEGGDVDIIFVEDGDHRLSRPVDLEMIDQEIKTLSGLR
jgi:pimeloyl-ACP methyl ester carboxylesterase